MSAPAASLPVDRTLRVIVVGFRLVAAVWITIVGVIALVSWDAKPWVVLVTLALAWAWAGATAAAPRRVLKSWPWLAADLIVGTWTAMAPAFTDQDTGGTFSGGYPFSTVLVWAYAYGIPGGVISGAIVSFIALTPGVSELTTDISTALIYVAGGGVALFENRVVIRAKRCVNSGSSSRGNA